MANLSEKFIRDLNKDISSIKSDIKKVKSTIESVDSSERESEEITNLDSSNLDALRTEIISSIERNGFKPEEFPLEDITKGISEKISGSVEETIDNKLDNSDRSLSVDLDMDTSGELRINPKELDEIFSKYSKKIVSLDKKIEESLDSGDNYSVDNIVIESPGEEILKLEDSEFSDEEQETPDNLDINQLVSEITEALKVPIEDEESESVAEEEFESNNIDLPIREYLDSVDDGINEIPKSVESLVEIIRETQPIEIIEEKEPEEEEENVELSKNRKEEYPEEEEGSPSQEKEIVEMVQESPTVIEEVDLESPDVVMEDADTEFDVDKIIDLMKPLEIPDIELKVETRDLLVPESIEDDNKEDFEDYLENREIQKIIDTTDKETPDEGYEFKGDQQNLNDLEEVDSIIEKEDSPELLSVNETINNLTELIENEDSEREEYPDIIVEPEVKLVDDDVEEYQILTNEIQTLIKETPREGMGPEIMEGNERIASKIDELIKVVSESGIVNPSPPIMPDKEKAVKKERDPLKRKEIPSNKEKSMDLFGPEAIRLLNKISKSLSGPLRISENKPHRPNSRFS